MDHPLVTLYNSKFTINVHIYQHVFLQVQFILNSCLHKETFAASVFHNKQAQMQN